MNFIPLGSATDEHLAWSHQVVSGPSDLDDSGIGFSVFDSSDWNYCDLNSFP